VEFVVMDEGERCFKGYDEEDQGQDKEDCSTRISEPGRMVGSLDIFL